MNALLLPLLLAAAQQDPRPPTPPELPGEEAGLEEPLLASDGRPVEPGRLPEDTPPLARRRWEKLLGATLADALPSIRSFELVFDVRSRREGAFNELDVGITYLESEHPRAPFLRLFLQREDLVSIHGPDGQWLVDGDTAQRMTGRDYREDRRQLEEYRTLAGNLLALVQPGRVRLVSLRPLEVASSEQGTRVPFVGAEPLDLPTPRLAEHARRLEWIELRSPDLRVHEAGGAVTRDAVYRGRLGIEPGSGQVRLAVLAAESSAGRPLARTALLVQVHTYAELEGGYRLPRHLEVKEIDPRSSPLSFAKREGAELMLLPSRSAVNPGGLSTTAFRPR